MKLLLTALAISLVALAAAHATENEHEMFNQLCVLLELNDDEQKKLAVAFVSLEEGLHSATAGVGDKNVDPRDMVNEFDIARAAFRESVGTFLSKEQFDTMQKYSSAIFYALADDVALVRVKQYKTSLELTDTQIPALSLVVSEDLRSVVETFLLYNSGDTGKAAASAMRESLLEIREGTRAEVQKILTEDQWKKLELMRG
jgi:hypothetical protein